MELTLLYSTYPSPDAARAMATTLLEHALVACCNILPAGESLYRWQGALTQTPETIMLCKTTLAQASAAIAHMTANHPYECPAILRLPAYATSPFAAWVAVETLPAKS